MQDRPWLSFFIQGTGPGKDQRHWLGGCENKYGQKLEAGPGERDGNSRSSAEPGWVRRGRRIHRCGRWVVMEENRVLHIYFVPTTDTHESACLLQNSWSPKSVGVPCRMVGGEPSRRLRSLLGTLQRSIGANPKNHSQNEIIQDLNSLFVF